MKGLAGDPIDWSGALEGDPGTFYGGGNSGYPTYSSHSFDWGSLVQGLAKSGTSILSARYSVPQLNQGQYIQGNGMTMFQGGPNNNSFLPNLSSGVEGSSTMLMLGVAGIALFMMMKK